MRSPVAVVEAAAPGMIAEELAYVGRSRNWFVRAYRAARAAWRVSRIAARARRTFW